MIKEAIEKLVNKQDLTFDEAKEVMNEIMSGETPDILISAYLVALRMKGETIEEYQVQQEVCVIMEQNYYMTWM